MHKGPSGLDRKLGDMAKSARNIKARRRLRELYERGQEVRIDGEGVHHGPFEEPAPDDVVAIFVTPPSPLQREEALRDAQATRARAVLKAKKDENSEVALTAAAFTSDMSLDSLIDYVLVIDSEDRRQEAVRDVLGRKEWEDINELQDAMRQFDEAIERGEVEDPESNEDWAALLERDHEYGKQVQEREHELIDSSKESLRLMPREALEKRAWDRRIEIVGTGEFMRAYELHMLYYACRDAEDKQLLFWDTPEELASQPKELQEALGAVLAGYIQDGTEAKNSSRVADSSEQSPPPAEPETSESSTPVGATA